MPRVKTYDAPQARSNAPASAGFSARATPQQFGAGIGQALGQAGQVIAANAQKQQAEDNEAAIKATVNEFRKRLNDRQYGDDDAYYNRKGKDAYDSFSPMLDEFDDIRKEMAGNLAPGKQQELFNQLAEQYVLSDHRGMSRYAAAERTNWLNNEDTAGIEQAQADGALRYIDNGAYAEQIEKYVSTLSKRNGWGPEKQEQEQEKYVTAMHVDALEQIFVKSPAVAKDYFETHKDSISPALHDNIENQIKQHDTAVWVEEQAAAISFEGGSTTERISKVNELTDDPDRRKQLRAQINHDLAQEKRADQEYQTQAYSDAFTAILDPTGSGMSYVQFANQFPEQWEAMSPSQKRTIISDSTGGGKRETNLQAYYEVRGTLANNDFEGAREYLLNNTDSFTNTDWKSLMDKAWAGKSSNSTSDKSLLNAEARRQFDDWVEVYIGKEPPKGNKRVAWNEQRNFAMGMYEAQLEEGMGVPDRRNVLDKMTSEIVVNEPAWYKHKSFEDEEYQLHSLPEEQTRVITSTFDSLGIPMTPENIAVYVENELNLNDPKYARYIEALREGGYPVSVSSIMAIDNKLNQLPVE